MTWLAGQQRALDRIEKTLVADDYRLASRFAFFTRLARDDAMPGTERIQARPCRPRSALLAAAGLVAVTMFLVALPGPVRQVCPSATVTASAFSSSAARPAAGRCPGPVNQNRTRTPLTGKAGVPGKDSPA
ncbi:MAG TPA: hypothetical protein VHO07_27205 [Streptosporangiaceae bacterium]|nr:hypothetical protein [Streptosporangiaceae bacterium]